MSGPFFPRLVRRCFQCATAIVLACFPHLVPAQAGTPYGPDDRLGAINNINAETVVRAIGLVKTGKVYSLAIETKPNTDSPGPRIYRAIIQPFSTKGSNKTTGYEDTVMLSPSLGTSMDGLGHVGRDGIHYNGVRAEDIYGVKGAKIFSIDTLPPIVTRGVLLDIARHRGESVVPSGTAVNKADIQAMTKAQGVTIRRGDVVLLHTGWFDATKEMKSAGGVPGFGKDGARYLAELGVVAVGGDAGAEVFPAETKGEGAPVHQILLADHGVYILEGVKTKDLATDRAYESLFILAAPRLAGTVQATIHPVAVR